MTLTRRMAGAALASAFFAAVMPAMAQAKRISRQDIEAMFANMRARAPWNVDGPLLWGYFFLDADESKLKAAATELQSMGYRVVRLGKVDGRGLPQLHVERVEVHTPASLDARNGQLYELAARYGIASYDGMDVGPVGQPTPRQ